MITIRTGLISSFYSPTIGNITCVFQMQDADMLLINAFNEHGNVWDHIIYEQIDDINAAEVYSILRLTAEKIIDNEIWWNTRDEKVLILGLSIKDRDISIPIRKRH